MSLVEHRQLVEEIRRYVKLMPNVTARTVVEGLRNRWQVRLENERGEDFDYYFEVMEVIRLLVEKGQLFHDASMSTVNVRRTEEAPRSWISFAWTTKALIEGVKRVTRRTWKDNYATQFNQGDLVTAYDKQPRFGGKPVAIIRLTQTPYRQMSDKVSTMDWHDEGFAWMEKQGLKVGKLTPRQLWDQWHDQPEFFWVIRFEVVELL